MDPFAAAMIAAVASPLRAQVGSSTDILVGKVMGPDGRALQGARVEATSIETGVTRSRSTDAQGRYTILFPDGGGQYRVTARMLGLSPNTAQVNCQADEDRLVHDFVMTTVAATLDAIVVNARQASEFRGVAHGADEAPHRLQVARNNYLAALEGIKGVLTAEQRAMLPENFRNPVLRGPGLGRPAGEGRPPQRPPEQ